MHTDRTGPPRGRQKEADRNDERILRAAREVFAEHGWDAPVSEVARRAGVGMGSLYRRYPAKEDLAQALRVEGMNDLASLAGTAMADHPDPWAALVSFLRATLSATGTGSLLPLIGAACPPPTKWTPRTTASGRHSMSWSTPPTGPAHYARTSARPTSCCCSPTSTPACPRPPSARSNCTCATWTSS